MIQVKPKWVILSAITLVVLVGGYYGIQWLIERRAAQRFEAQQQEYLKKLGEQQQKAEAEQQRQAVIQSKLETNQQQLERINETLNELQGRLNNARSHREQREQDYYQNRRPLDPSVRVDISKLCAELASDEFGYPCRD